MNSSPTTAVSFSTLPLEVKDRIFKLVDEQDGTYRNRIRAAAAARQKLKLGPPKGGAQFRMALRANYGKGINQLALCSHQLGDLASQYLYSHLSTQLSENPLFSFWILNSHRHCFKSVTFKASKMTYNLSTSHTFPPALAALPGLPNLTTIRIEGYLDWIPEFIRLYHHHPFSCVAAKLQLLELKIIQSDIDLRVVEGADEEVIFRQLLATVPCMTSLNLDIVGIGNQLLIDISSLDHLQILTIKAAEVQPDRRRRPDPQWKRCSSLRRLSIEVPGDGCYPALVAWIQTVGVEIETLTVNCYSYSLVNPYCDVQREEELVAMMTSFCFPSLRRLSITFEDPRDHLSVTQISKLLRSSCLASVCINNHLELWGNELNIINIGNMWAALKGVEFLGSEGFEERAHQLVKDFCEPQDHRYRYGKFSSSSPSNLTPPGPSQTQESSLNNWEQSITPLLSYASRRVKQIIVEGNLRASSELSDALKELKERDEE